MKKPHWLKNLRVDRIALVDNGANQDAHVVLFKRKAKEPPMPDESVVDEVVRKQVVDLQKQVETAEAARKAAEATATDLAKKLDGQAAAIAKMQTERRNTEFVAKARTIPAFGKAEEFGPILAKIEGALTAEEYGKVETRFKAINDQLGASELLREIGGGGGDEPASATAKLDALAKVHQKEKGVTYEAAYAVVIKSAEGSALFRQATKEAK